MDAELLREKNKEINDALAAMKEVQEIDRQLQALEQLQDEEEKTAKKAELELNEFLQTFKGFNIG